MINRVRKYIASYTHRDWSKIGNGRKYALIFDCMLSRIVDGSNTEGYLTSEFYKKNHRERRMYMTNRRMQRINRRILAGASEGEKYSIGNKYAFNKKYSKWVSRDFVYTPEATAAELAAFVEKHGEVLVKPVGKTQGTGIYKLVYDPETVASVTEDLKQDEYVLEQIIRQHPEMEKVNPSSVNTIRVITVLDRTHKAHIVMAMLRGGGAGSIVDNFHAGGAIYPLNLEEGVVFMPGRNSIGDETYLRHPATGHMMMGFAVPHWALLKQAVLEAAELSDELRLLGWDVAITEQGVEFVEANYGCGMAERDHVGKYKLVKELLGF